MNNTKGLISVIIPCYNASNYIRLLADDLLKQEYDNYEAIFVNDGDDLQDEILEDIKKLDKRFRIYKKENGGVSSARNLGLEKAKGEWVVFVDSDDTVKPYFLDSLYNAVKESKADFGFGGYYANESNGMEFYSVDLKLLQKGCVCFTEFFDYIEKNIYYKACWAKIFKKEIIDDYAIRFDTRFSMGEDWTFVLMYYKHTNYVAIVENCGYCYNCSSTSGLSSKYDPMHMQLILESIELLSILRQRIGRCNMQIKIERDRDYAFLCFSFLKNLYCTKGHPSLCESIQLIKNQLISNKLLLTALRLAKVQKTSDKIQKIIIMTGNAVVIAITHKILYGLWHRRW